jgi:hypothetical protein
MNTPSVLVITTSTMLFLMMSVHTLTGACVSGPLAAFRESVAHYMLLHQRAERQVGRLQVTERVRQIIDVSDALAAAIQEARRSAREGDLFTAEIAEAIRGRIARALREAGYYPRDVVAASREDVAEAAEYPVVNGRFPWSRGAAMWPVILHVLPGLPEDLQYRVVDDDLILIDVKANLVVDILRDAIAERSAD